MQGSVITEIASAIHVRQIRTTMDTVARFNRSSQVSEVVTHMERHQFDVAPVFPDNADPGPRHRLDPDGVLSRRDLRDMDPEVEIGPAVRSLSSDVLIDSRASLLELLDRFRLGHTFLLVVGSGGLDGIVTPSDMNKQAGRTHLFMHVSALELALATRLRASLRSEGEVLGCLTDAEARKIRGRLRRQRESDQVADLVAMLDLQDLLQIEAGLATSGLLSTLDGDQIKGLAVFRNRVMHSVLQPAGDAPEHLNELLHHTELVQRLLEALADRPG